MYNLLCTMHTRDPDLDPEQRQTRQPIDWGDIIVTLLGRMNTDRVLGESVTERLGW